MSTDALSDVLSAVVCVGSKSEAGAAASHIRSTPKTGRSCRYSAGQLLGQFRTHASQQSRLIRLIWTQS